MAIYDEFEFKGNHRSCYPKEKKMKKKLGDLTVRELVEMCNKQPGQLNRCTTCPVGKIPMYCDDWYLEKVHKEDLEKEIEVEG